MKYFFILFSLVSSLYAQEHQNLTVQTLNGDDVAVESLIQQGPVLVNFWALWCEPCKLEMRTLQSLYEKYKDRNFSILAINQDNQKSVSKVSSFIASLEYSFYVSTDPNGEVAQQFNVQNIPFSLLFDKNGKVVYKAIGYKPGDEKKLEAALEKILSVKNDE